MVHIKKLINKLIKKQMETVDPQPRTEMRIKCPDWVLGTRLARQQGPRGLVGAPPSIASLCTMSLCADSSFLRFPETLPFPQI